MYIIYKYFWKTFYSVFPVLATRGFTNFYFHGAMMSLNGRPNADPYRVQDIGFGSSRAMGSIINTRKIVKAQKET